MKRLLLASTALLLPAAAQAQTQDGFNIPTDIFEAQGPYVEVVPIYASGSTRNTTIDPTVTPPPARDMFEDIPSEENSDKISTDDYSSAFCLTIAEGGSCQEPKFRTEADVNKILFDDPIRNPRQPGESHCHQFFGNEAINAYSTFETLRTNNRSTARGGDLNASGYWFPCPVIENAFGDGKNYAVRADHIIIYYQESDSTADNSAAIELGLRTVFGSDMDDPARSWMQAHVDAANAQPGTASDRYRQTLTKNGTDWRSRPKYWCSGATPQLVDRIVNVDGSDPHAGTCNTGQEYNIRIEGTRCWDGRNLWSPGGYRHVIPEIWDKTYSEWVCPTNYYRIPALQLQIKFTQTGFADRERWRLASDDHYDTLAGTPQGSGASFHTDYIPAWNKTTMDKWQDNCIGVEGGTSHECNSSTISGTERLRNVLVNPSDTYGTATADKMWELPDQQSGPATIHVHGD